MKPLVVRADACRFAAHHVAEHWLFYTAFGLASGRAEFEYLGERERSENKCKKYIYICISNMMHSQGWIRFLISKKDVARKL